jgi:hypothetical protein
MEGDVIDVLTFALPSIALGAARAADPYVTLSEIERHRRRRTAGVAAPSRDPSFA